MDQFQDIRPYNDEEVRPVIDALLHNPEFIRSIAGFSFPRLYRFFPALECLLTRRRLRTQLRDVNDVRSMQAVIAFYMDQMIEKTTSSALNGDPSWNFTPGRSLKRQVSGPVCDHSVARAGTKLSCRSRLKSVS